MSLAGIVAREGAVLAPQARILVGARCASAGGAPQDAYHKAKETLETAYGSTTKKVGAAFEATKHAAEHAYESTVDTIHTIEEKLHLRQTKGKSDESEKDAKKRTDEKD